MAAFKHYHITLPIEKESHRAVEDAEINADIHIKILHAMENSKEKNNNLKFLLLEHF